MIISKLIKVDSFQKNENRLLLIKTGECRVGYFKKYPEKGQNFVFYEEKSGPIYTTVVTEIVDDRTFHTKNSIYKIVTLEDERDEKIKILFI